MKDRAIKLFVDAHSFDAGYQGVRTFISELYAGLLSRYTHLDIYWGVEDAEKIKAVFPTVKDENILIYKKRRPAILRFIFDIPALVREHGFDYAHFQYIAPLRQGDCKYIVTTHDVLFKDHPSDFSWAYRLSRDILFRRSIRKADIKTTVSEYSKQRIAHHYHIPAAAIKVIPNGVSWPDISKEAARAIVKAKFGLEDFILYVSRIEPRKNHALLLKKYLKLGLYKQQIPLVFIGGRSVAVKELDELTSDLTDEQAAMFRWLPRVEEADLEAFYSACRLFVYPSKAEGFGIPPLEAAICEAPVLCSRATAMGCYSFFEPYTFDPDNEADLEQKLAGILAHPPGNGTIKNIAATVAKKYQWQQSARLFNDLLSHGRRCHPPVTQLTTKHSDTIHQPHFTI